MDKSTCPVCCKEFPRGQIEAHVDKCLFLNSENDASTKRTTEDDSPLRNSAKKIKPSTHNFDELKSSEATEKEVPTRCGRKPLAEQMRPSSLNTFVGQEHILNRNGLFRSLIEQNNIPSMILWGPPGCGKTSLAHVINRICQERRSETRFVKLSAIMAGVNDIKEIVQVAKNEMTNFKRRTILFMDEIHRFNKLQQDIFLPHVEAGTITLIGATTENPSFSLNSALLSRCRVFVLEKLKSENVLTILRRAACQIGAVVSEKTDTHLEESSAKYIIESETLQWLSDMCDGDARIALNSFQMAIESNRSDKPTIQITLDDIKEGIKKSHILYDKKGEEHYNTISALHKSIRASDDNAALYWLARMLEGGEDPMFIARRLVRAASEDIGISDPMALTLAVSAMHGCQMIGMPECNVLLAQVAVYLARTSKSQEIYRALGKASVCIKSHKGPLPSVPLHLRNAPTKLMKDLGYGRDYNMLHKDESNLCYLPEGLETTSFFQN